MADSADKIAVTNGANAPSSMAALDFIISQIRTALAPWLNADLENIDQHQSEIITACAFNAGLTVGHMTFVGSMLPRDHKRAEKVVLINFRKGIKVGLREAAFHASQQSKVN